MRDQPPAQSPAAEPEALDAHDYLLTFAPVPTHARRDGWTVERQRGFMEALRATGGITAATPIVSTSCQLSLARSSQSGAADLLRQPARDPETV